MYKYLSIGLAVALLVAIGFYAFEKNAHSKSRSELTSKIAELEGMVQETETAFSARGVEIKDLESNNKELQKIIENRDEEIASLGEVVLKWKNKFFEIKDAKEDVVSPDGTTVVEIPADCQSCMKELRLRVTFDQVQEFTRVKGYTLTNPAYANIELSYERDLRLSFILTKKDDQLRLYFDSESKDIVPMDLTLKVDPSVFERKWYEKISLNSSLNFGKYGGIISLGAGYDIISNLSLGPSFMLMYDGSSAKTYFGANVNWHPFAK